MTITGELGIGKTRMVREVCALGDARGFCVLRGSAPGPGREHPFAPILDALDSHNDAGSSSDGVPQVASVGWRLGRPGVLHELLARVAEQRPVVLALDDLQWLDRASADLLATLVPALSGARILLVLSCRSGQWPSPLAEALSSPASRRDVTDIHLSPLSAGEIGDLVDPPLPRRLRRRIARESGGNPFYALALARSLEGGTAADVPSFVLAAVDEHLSSLSPGAFELVRAGSVLGDRFSIELAASVAQLSDSDLQRSLEELTKRRLLQLGPGADISFPAPMARRAVYQGMGLASRLSRHRLAARQLREAGGPLDVQAHHVELGGGAAPSDVGVLLEAADAASATRPPEAARWYVAALRRMADSDERRRHALVSASAALVMVGRIAEAREAFEQFDAAMTRDALDDPLTLLRAARVEHMLGIAGPTRIALRRSLTRDPSPAHAPELRLAMTMDHWRLSERDQMVREARVAVDAAQLVADPGVHLKATGLAGLAEYSCGRTTSALEHLDTLERLLPATADARALDLVEGLILLGYLNHGLERYATAEGHFLRGIGLARSAGYTYLLVPLTIGRAGVEAATGRLSRAWSTAIRSRELASRFGGRQGIMWAYSLMTRVAVAQGRKSVAMEAAEQATRAADGVASGFLTDVARCCLGMARIESGLAHAGYQSILRHGGGSGLNKLDAASRPGWYATLAEAARLMDDPGLADQWVLRAEASASTLGLVSPAATARAARARLLMDLQPDVSADLASGAAEAFETVGRLADAGEALTIVGRALARTGDERGAVSTLRRAHSILSESGAQRSRDLAARELRRMGQAIARPQGVGDTPPGIDALSHREREVAELVAKGLTNQRIAEELLVSAKTVEDHLARSFAKLGVSSRAGVAAVIAGGGR